jgi:hypothetical protein
MTAIDYRIERFRELHSNKWFHIMNWTLDAMRAVDPENRWALTKYGSVFYF